jgi:ABC-2 type transport system ATP-binding protein
VLLNSHLLSEAERCCDRVAILNKGALVTEGALQDVLARSQGGGILVRTAPAPDDALVAALAPLVKSAKREGDDAVVVELASDGDVDKVVDLVRARGLSLRELAPRRATLEDVFLGLVVPPEETAS